jgi:ATP-binding cassette subfamily B protein/subfamily B ATP-binding cassette protein MsbA
MIYRRVLRYYRPFVGPTVAGLLLALAGIAFNLLKPWPLKIIVDDLIPEQPEPLLPLLRGSRSSRRIRRDCSFSAARLS